MKSALMEFQNPVEATLPNPEELVDLVICDDEMSALIEAEPFSGDVSCMLVLGSQGKLFRIVRDDDRPEGGVGGHLEMIEVDQSWVMAVLFQFVEQVTRR